MIGYNFSVNPETLDHFNSSISHVFCDFYIYEDNFSDLDINQMLQYNKSKGKNSNINPTMRSKLIFGVASIMKKMHQKKISFRRLNDNGIKLDKNLEPKIFDFSKSTFAINKTSYGGEYTIGYPLYTSPEDIAGKRPCYRETAADVYSYAIFIYTLFLKSMNFKYSDGREFNLHNHFMVYSKIVDGIRFERLENIPDHYWELIVLCWDENPFARPSFDEIVDLLKDDKFALNEFGVETNLDELHEYQERIEKN